MQTKHTHKKALLITFFLSFSSIACFAQGDEKENIDFLSRSSFEELSSAHETSESDEMAISFAKAYLHKAKRENDALKTAKGYYKIGRSLVKKVEFEMAKQYLDSVIQVTKENYTNEYPAEAYIMRANVNGSQANYTSAMDDLAEATVYASKTNNVNQKYQIKYFIALLKNNIGEYEEGLKLLKECLGYEKTKFLKNENNHKKYIKSLFSVGNQFNLLKQADSSLIYTKKAIDISLKTKEKPLYDRLILDAAISYNLKKEYFRSLDSLLKYQEIIKTKKSSVGTMIRADFYFGDAYYKLDKKEVALEYLKEIDSLAFKENYFFPGIENNYELLIDYYKDNPKQQLLYINKLLYVDSILDKDFSNLSKKLYNDYDTPNLIREKQLLIKKLESKNTQGNQIILVISIIAIILITLLIWYYRKQKIYKKRFDDLLRKVESQEGKQSFTPSGRLGNIDISEDVVTDVLKKLQTFEDRKGYLQLDLSLGNLAKQFNTNSKYFSKIINTYKGKSFTNYINDLRIDYVVNELKNNLTLRRYTVKAIAHEIGFNTTEAFSKSFYKTTGIYPSFFIKQLEKQ